MKRNSFASLGFNCEAAYQFRRINGIDDASFFSWTYCKFHPMMEIIRDDFQELVQWENIQKSGIMIWDRVKDVSFHGPVFNEATDGQDVEKAKSLLATLHSKINFLAERWRYTGTSEGLTTYFLKIKHNDLTMRNPKASTKELRDLILQNYPNHDFRIIVLQSAQSVQPEDDWNEDRIFNRYLERYAADSDPGGDAHEESWDRIFAEFPVTLEVPERKDYDRWYDHFFATQNDYVSDADTGWLAWQECARLYPIPSKIPGWDERKSFEEAIGGRSDRNVNVRKSYWLCWRLWRKRIDIADWYKTRMPD